MGCPARIVGVGEVARASSADALLSASMEPEPDTKIRWLRVDNSYDNVRRKAACICIADGLLSFVPKMFLTELNGCEPNSPAVGDVKDMLDAARRTRQHDQHQYQMIDG